MNTSGILLVDKPEGISSASVISKIQKKFQLPKIGHGGTLDPFATGLLIALIGEATKISRFLLQGNKTYEASAFIGQATNTGDKDGEPTIHSSSPYPSLKNWEQTLPLGTFQQIPPDYSSVKVKGMALYKYARENKPIPPKPLKTVTIHALNILKSEPPLLKFMVTSSGGTYIRTLAEDWAKANKTQAHLVELRRTQSSHFSIQNSHSLEWLLNSKTLPPLIPLEAAMPQISQVSCPSEFAPKITSGNKEFLKEFLSHVQPKPEYLLIQGEKKSLALVKKNIHGNYTIERVFL